MTKWICPGLIARLYRFFVWSARQWAATKDEMKDYNFTHPAGNFLHWFLAPLYR